MDNKEYPIFTMIVCTVAAWSVVKLATGNDKYALIVAIATFIYSVYLGSIYAENGKQAMMKKLKAQVIQVSVIIVALAVSIWLAGIVSGWIGVESFFGKFLVWFALLIIVVVFEILSIPRKR